MAGCLSLSSTRREYIPVGSTAASMRLTVSAKDRHSAILYHFSGVMGVYYKSS
ncbi:MAG: hypothetical protein GXP22_09220 [Gammaproteobacteria bacterium]|nr:hypothetical protein [Gammaproteobacteria bacterium]